MSELKIEVRRFYRTRGSQKAQVYAVHDVRHDFPIHGAILGDNGRWVMETWNCNGKHWFTEDSTLDLVSPWINPPEVDWDRFPKHIVAVAMDEDGDWHGFSDVPVANNLDKGWYSSISGCHDLYRTFELYDNDCPEFSGDWRDSLAIRPGHEPYTQPFPPHNSNEPTPGPWRIDNGSCVVADGMTGHDHPETIRAYGGHLVCESASKGNLHLIAAAPELYEVCKEAMAFIRHYAPEEKSLSGRLHSAVCSAEGIPF